MIQLSSNGLRSNWKGCQGHFLGLCASSLLHHRILLFLALVLVTGVTMILLWSRLAIGNSLRTGRQERDYGVVIDAGSSSNKLHLFQWPPHDGDPSKLLTIKTLVNELGDPLTKKVEPGIATFSESPDMAFTSLQPLLDFSLDHIPPTHHQHTSLYIFCTAGLRLLSKVDQQRIISVLNERVSEEYPFHMPKDGIQVISGKLEGVYSWIAINYLMGKLSPDSHAHHLSQQLLEPEWYPGSSSSESKPPNGSSGGNEIHSINTVGALDMGGASLQVAFEISPEIDISPELSVDINLGCGVDGPAGNQHKHRIFVSTYLGYGANQARTRYYQQLLMAHLMTSNQSQHLDSGIHLHSLRDPCAPLDSVENITVNGHYIKIRGLGDFSGCKKSLLPLLRASSKNKTADTATRDNIGSSFQLPCTGSHHSCNNLIQDFQRPTLPFKFEALDFYGTSEFLYSMRDILMMGGHYTASRYEEASIQYCQTSWKVLLDHFLKELYIHADFYRLKSQCMKSAWLSLILHEGLGFPKDTFSLYSVSSIRGQSVQWPLGALLYHTRYLPLREVQLHKLQIPPVSQSWITYFSLLLQSSFLLPLLTVLLVIVFLLCCRHRHRRPYFSVPVSPLHRSQSLNSLIKVHRRYPSGSAMQISEMGMPPSTEFKGMPMNSSGKSGFINKDSKWTSSRSKFMI